MTDLPGGLLTVLSVFLMGLGLNLTPCVYPMITVTVSLFTNRGKVSENRWQLFLKALLYVFGIVTMYSALGVFAALTGEFFGAILQSQWALVGIAFFLLVLALSLLGVYSFGLPSWFVEKIGGGRKTNFFGIFFAGLCVGIFAAPCIGPPVIALLTFVGTRGDPFFAFWVFFILSLGLGTPYLILGTFSGLIKKLPKSGSWLVWIEHLFGVLLVVLSVFYLMIALNPGLLSWLPTVSLIGGGVYLGFFERSGALRSNFTWFKRIAGTIALLAGIAIPLLWPKERIVWENYEPEKIALAKEQRKPVVIDFYADWCLPCYELNQLTYTNPQVIQALENFERLKVNLTQRDAKAPRELIDRFHIIGVPTVLFLDPEGSEVEEARITGFVTPEEFLNIVRSLPFEATQTPANETENF